MYGRDEEIERLARSAAPITLLTGDSGVGKSTVLEAAQAATETALAPMPRRVAAAGGVLQSTLLSALGDALAEDIQERGRVAEIGRLLAATAEALVEAKGQEVARVVGQELLAIVRGRLGPDVGNAVVEYGKALKETADERLAMRLQAALDRTAVETVIEFGNAIAEQSVQGAVVLALDAGERLPTADLGLLADLAEGFLKTVHLRIAMADDGDERRAAVERLLALNREIVEIPLHGIRLGAVRRWLEDEGLDSALAERVGRATAGYGLHVGDLIAHLHQGGEPDDAPLHQQLARRTDDAWRGLSVDVASVARRLCVLIDPLPHNSTLALLGINAATWGKISGRLQCARIFSVHVDGQAWFHDERRRYILSAKLSDEERAEACTNAVPYVRALVVEGLAQRSAELADLVAGSPSLLDADEQVAGVVALGADEIAVAAALVELMEPEMRLPAVGGDELLRHARDLPAVRRSCSRSSCAGNHIVRSGDRASGCGGRGPLLARRSRGVDHLWPRIALAGVGCRFRPPRARSGRSSFAHGWGGSPSQATALAIPAWPSSPGKATTLYASIATRSASLRSEPVCSCVATMPTAASISTRISRPKRIAQPPPRQPRPPRHRGVWSTVLAR